MVIANSSVVKVFATLAGILTYLRHQKFYLKEILTIALPAIIVVFISSYGLSQVVFSKTLFSLIFILLLLPMLLKMLLDARKSTLGSIELAPSYNAPKLILLGLVAGVVPSVSGLGGGFIVVPVLIYFLGYSVNQSISISLGVIFCTSLALCAYYGFAFQLPEGIPKVLGGISYGISLPMIVGVLLAAPIGVKVSNTLKPSTIRLLFVAICLIIIGKTIIVDLM